MTYIDALCKCNLSNETLEELYAYMDNLIATDEVHLLHWPYHIEKIINILIKPDALLVIHSMDGERELFLNRVLVYKNRIRCPFYKGYPNEYEFIRKLIGDVY